MTEKAEKLGEIKWEDADTSTVIAAMAMQGILEREVNAINSKVIVETAKYCAEALLEELVKE